MKKIKCDTKWPVYKIERKTGVRYYAVFSPRNSDQVTKTFKTKNEAVQWLKTQHSELQKLRDPSKFEYRFKSVEWLCDYWVENYAKVYKQHSSITRDRLYIQKQILPTFGKLRISEVTPQRVEVWLGCIKRKLSPKSCNDSLGLLKKIFNDACRWRFVESNPTLGVKRLTVPENDIQFWSFEEKAIFLNYVFQNYPKYYFVFLTATSTGMRAGEMAGLQWDCVDLRTNQITVKRSFCQKAKALKESTKSSRIRRIPLNPQLKDCFVVEKGASRSKFVFGDLKFHNLSRTMKRICREARVPEIHFHGLRHVFASHLAMSGIALFELQKLLGHQTIQMTERYSHLMPNALNGLTDVLAVPVAPRQNVININDHK